MVSRGTREHASSIIYGWDGTISSHLQSHCHLRLGIVLHDIQLQIGIPSKDRTTRLQILGHP